MENTPKYKPDVPKGGSDNKPTNSKIPMKIEAVIVCINYSDFLKVTLPYNKNMFDRLVVVTDTKDEQTAKTCEFWNVECVKTDIFYRDDAKVPNKALGINEGLKKLAGDGWVVQLDADIWLPPLTRDILHNLPLKNDCIYGMDRLMCNSYNDWYNFITLQGNVQPIHEGWIYLHLHQFPIGQRIVQYHGEGYMPIGYFQMWNPKGSGVTTYPVEISGFDRTDVCHLKQFKRENRLFLPELVCIHLASEVHIQGQNWRGRTSRDFLPVLEASALMQAAVGIHVDGTKGGLKETVETVDTTPLEVTTVEKTVNQSIDPVTKDQIVTTVEKKTVVHHIAKLFGLKKKVA